MHTTFKHVVHHVNANPAIYVDHALWSRVMPSSERMRVSNMLSGVSDPLFAFGSDVLDYYHAPQGPRVSRGMASGHRLIKSIEATTVKQAVIDTLAPKEIKYDYVAVREAFGEIGDGLPLVTVDLRPGREAERKKALVDAIAAIIFAELGVDPLDLYVLFRETPAENHYTGGSPLPAWVPADQ